MRAKIHPECQEVTFTCSCGNKIKVLSTAHVQKFNIEICDKCHPFYTGKQKLIDTAGRVEKFRKRYDIPMNDTKEKKQ